LISELMAMTMTTMVVEKNLRPAWELEVTE